MAERTTAARQDSNGRRQPPFLLSVSPRCLTLTPILEPEKALNAIMAERTAASRQDSIEREMAKFARISKLLSNPVSGISEFLNKPFLEVVVHLDGEANFWEEPLSPSKWKIMQLLTVPMTISQLTPIALVYGSYKFITWGMKR